MTGLAAINAFSWAMHRRGRPRCAKRLYASASRLTVMPLEIIARSPCAISTPGMTRSTCSRVTNFILRPTSESGSGNECEEFLTRNLRGQWKREKTTGSWSDFVNFGAGLRRRLPSTESVWAAGNCKKTPSLLSYVIPELLPALRIFRQFVPS